MCTAATYRSQDFYFGRTFDYEFNYGEEVTVTPRNYPFPLRHQNALTEHYAMIGIAHMAGDYPLYYDAVNEKGLGMAGLNFPGNAVYSKVQTGKDNIAQFEFIPWILGQCANVQEARVLLSGGSIDEQSPVSNPDVSFERLYVPVFRITDKPFFRRSEAEAVQQRHGSHGTARGSVFCIPFCTGGIHEDEFPVRIV